MAVFLYYLPGREYLKVGFALPHGELARAGMTLVRDGPKIHQSDVFKLFFSNTGLLKNFSECSSGYIARVHGNVCLSSIRMAQDNMRTALALFLNPARLSLLKSSRAEYGIVHFDFAEITFSFAGYWF